VLKGVIMSKKFLNASSVVWKQQKGNFFRCESLCFHLSILNSVASKVMHNNGDLLLLIQFMSVWPTNLRAMVREFGAIVRANCAAVRERELWISLVAANVRR
jgi:hypothetical protein